MTRVQQWAAPPWRDSEAGRQVPHRPAQGMTRAFRRSATEYRAGADPRKRREADRHPDRAATPLPQIMEKD